MKHLEGGADVAVDPEVEQVFRAVLCHPVGGDHAVFGVLHPRDGVAKRLCLFQKEGILGGAVQIQEGAHNGGGAPFAFAFLVFSS